MFCEYRFPAMLPDHLCHRDIPKLDEGLPVEVYAELTDTMLESVIRDIQAKRLLGVSHNGEWYVEAPAFCEVKLQQIWNRGQSNGRNHANRSNQNSTPPPKIETNLDIRFANVLGLSGRMTRDEVKRKWKQLTIQYHPDKVAHLGPKLRDVAEVEMKAINEAYDYFRTKYQF